MHVTVPVARSEAPPLRPGVPPFARRAVLVIAAVTGLVHLVAAVASPGYWFDESLMLAIGRHHLDWGSADQPPVAPLLAALADHVVPGSLTVLRLPAVLATAAAVVVAALIARELGGDRRAQLLTAGAQATIVFTAFGGHWLSPYVLEPLQWLLLFWLVVRWVRTRSDRLLPLLGIVVGVAAQTKFQVLLLSAVLLLAVAVVGPRELLRRPMLWCGAAIAVVIALPTLLWQSHNGWPQLQMAAVVTAESEQLGHGRPGAALLLIVMAGVAGTWLSAYGLFRLLRSEQMRAHRFLGVAALALYVLFVATAGRPYYLAGMYGLLAAVGALGLQRRRESGARRWPAWPAYLLSTVVALGGVWVSLPLTDPSPALQITDRTAEAYRDLPAPLRERTVVMGESYIYAGYLDAYGAGRLPPAYSGSRSYGWFDPPPPGADAVLYAGTDPSSLRPWFGDLRPVGTIGPGAGLWLATDRRVPWPEFWPRLRTLEVGWAPGATTSPGRTEGWGTTKG